MHRLNKLYLALHTRNQDEASSSDEVIIYQGANELVRMGAAPPGNGLAAVLEADVNVDYEQLLGDQVWIGTTGTDRWGPRSAFLWGNIPAPNGTTQVPLAHNLYGLPIPTWVTQNLAEGVQRWELTRYTHAAATYDSFASLVLIVQTNAGQFSATAGPLELSVYVRAEPGAGTWVDSLAFQTVLTRRGQQEPAVRGGAYIADFANQFIARRYGDVTRFVLRNLSDDMWRPDRIALFGTASSRARLLGIREDLNVSISQDPYDGPGNQRAYQSLLADHSLSVLDL